MRCLAPRGDDAAVDDVSDDGVDSGKVLADDEVRFEPHPHPQKRYDPIDMQPRLELLFEEALVPAPRPRPLPVRVEAGARRTTALSNEIKGLVLRRAHLREILAALRAARAAAPPASIPDAEPPKALVEAVVDARRRRARPRCGRRSFPARPPLPGCVRP